MTMHQAKVFVSGGGALPVEKQAEIIRLNPGVEGLAPEAYVLAAEQDAAGVPLPDVAATIPVAAEGVDLQAQSNADASATGQVGTEAPAPAVVADATSGELSATVEQTPAGDGWLVKLSDKPEALFAATEQEVEEFTRGYSRPVAA